MPGGKDGGTVKTLSLHHPGAVSVYFLCVLLPVVFGLDPVRGAIGLASGLLLWGLTDETRSLRGAAFYLAVPALSALINPLFNHNGVSVLFFLNSNPITREAVLNGLVLGLVLSAALVWGRCFSAVMDADRLLTVTSALSPKLSLVLSMTLRMIPLLRRQTVRTREAHTGAGLRREDNMPDRIRGGARVFSGLVTWALENGIVTADSMTARGYGTGRRTRYRRMAWERGDTLVTCIAPALFALSLLSRWLGHPGYVWYPVLVPPAFGPAEAAGYASFALLCLAGAGLEAADRIRWRRRLREVKG